MIQTWLTEDPLQPVLWGLLFTAFALVLWFALRRPMLLILAILIFAITIGCVITERIIVTDREQITEAIYDMAECVRTNDVEGIIKHVKPTKTAFIDRIRSEIASYDLRICHVMGFNEQTLEGDPCKTATFEFVVWAEGARLVDRLPGKANVRVTLEFEKSGDRWFVVAYGYQPALGQREIHMNY